MLEVVTLNVDILKFNVIIMLLEGVRYERKGFKTLAFSTSNRNCYEVN